MDGQSTPPTRTCQGPVSSFMLDTNWQYVWDRVEPLARRHLEAPDTTELEVKLGRVDDGDWHPNVGAEAWWSLADMLMRSPSFAKQHISECDMDVYYGDVRVEYRAEDLPVPHHSDGGAWRAMFNVDMLRKFQDAYANNEDIGDLRPGEYTIRLPHHGFHARRVVQKNFKESESFSLRPAAFIQPSAGLHRVNPECSALRVTLASERVLDTDVQAYAKEKPTMVRLKRRLHVELPTVPYPSPPLSFDLTIGQSGPTLEDAVASPPVYEIEIEVLPHRGRISTHEVPLEQRAAALSKQLWGHGMALLTDMVPMDVAHAFTVHPTRTWRSRK